VHINLIEGRNLIQTKKGWKAHEGESHYLGAGGTSNIWRLHQ